MKSSRIKEARERCDLSQQELAALMGWKSHSSVVAIEKGEKKVKAWELLKFAQILKVSPESLYNEEAIVPKRPVALLRQRSAATFQEELELMEINWRRQCNL
jgi:DNA-binding XRE family transcriptional regulator